MKYIPASEVERLLEIWAQREKEAGLIHPGVVELSALLASAVELPESDENWNGPWKCEKCRNTFLGPVVYHSGSFEHDGTRSICDGTLVPWERRVRPAPDNKLREAANLIDAILGTVPIAVRRKWPNVYRHANEFAREHRGAALRKKEEK